MQLLEGRLVLSATDLVGHLACERLTALEFGAARGQWPRPAHNDPELDLLQKKGIEHERRCLERFEAGGAAIARLAPAGAATIRELQRSEEETLRAMREGVAVIYQATLFDGQWAGHPDFLVRVDRPSNVGAWSYEPADAKLGQRVKAAALLQLCLYADRLRDIQGVAPNHIGIVVRDGTVYWHRLEDYRAYYRAVKTELQRRVATPGTLLAAYPNPVDHCRVCRWLAQCAEQRKADDHLCRVANITRTQTKRLVNGGLTTLTAVARSPAEFRVDDLARATLDRLRLQARLQADQYADGVVRYELLPPDPEEPKRGFALLPKPSPGDLFLDLESDPWASEDGLEFLFGVVTEVNNEAEYMPRWSHSAADEKESLEWLLDLITRRLREDPDTHVYHYGPYEKSALRRLVTRYATREDALDELLRGEVLVDLYAVLRQSLRVSQESYSLKKVEQLYMAQREGPVTHPGFAVVEYERWLEEQDDRVLASIEAYNRDDCVSTWKLRSWLEGRRVEAEERFGVHFDRPILKDGRPTDAMLEQNAGTLARVEQLTRDVPAEPGERSPEQQGGWILAQLLDWHRREAKPEWWKYYDLLERPVDELITSPEALGDIEYEGVVGEVKKSIIHRYIHDPEQEHKFKPGDKPLDPATQTGAGEVVAVDRTAGTIDLKRGKTSKAPHPRALIPGKPVGTDTLRDGLRRVADYVIAHGLEDPGPYQAVRDLLLRAPPRVRGLVRGESLIRSGEDALATARRHAIGLDESYLPIQGPPGSGKTFTAARMIVDLLERGRKIGVSATAHKAITNLLNEVCRAADEAGLDLRAVQRCEPEEACTHSVVTIAGSHEPITEGLVSGEFNLVSSLKDDPSFL